MKKEWRREGERQGCVVLGKLRKVSVSKIMG